MSEISKNIRKITKAWGGKTTGSGIGDAVMDLYNSLPFYSELGEKIISNEVSPSGESSSSVIDKELVKAIREYPENVVITKNTTNGPKVYKLGEIVSDNGYTITWNVPDPYGEGWHENNAGSLSITPSTGRVETGYNALDDNFLTISVAVPVEIVHPIDDKFMPDGYPKAERKEIVRSITLNATGPASARGEDITIAKLIYNNPELATVYHKDRPCKYLGIRDDKYSYATKFSYGIDGIDIVQINVSKSNEEPNGDLTAYFSELDYVNFVDIEVPDVEEVVKKLDPKFVDGVTVFYIDKHQNDVYLYSDPNLAIKVTKKECKSAFYKGPVYLKDQHSDWWFTVNTWGGIHNTEGSCWATILDDASGPDIESLTFHSAEYEEPSGPM